MLPLFDLRHPRDFKSTTSQRGVLYDTWYLVYDVDQYFLHLLWDICRRSSMRVGCLCCSVGQAIIDYSKLKSLFCRVIFRRVFTRSSTGVCGTGGTLAETNFGFTRHMAPVLAHANTSTKTYQVRHSANLVVNPQTFPSSFHLSYDAHDIAICAFGGLPARDLPHHAPGAILFS